MIGDADPEDAYDASDPPEVRLAVLALVLAALDAELDASSYRNMVRRTVLADRLHRLADDIEQVG